MKFDSLEGIWKYTVLVNGYQFVITDGLRNLQTLLVDRWRIFCTITSRRGEAVRPFFHFRMDMVQKIFQMGFYSAKGKVERYSGGWWRRYWLERIQCSGSELRLSECSHGGWGDGVTLLLLLLID